MTSGLDAATLVLLIPVLSAVLLALQPSWRLASFLNVASSGVTLLAAATLLVQRPSGGGYLAADDLNVTFLIVSAFVSFTTSIYSVHYIAFEVAIGKLEPLYARLYHAMYQALVFSMHLALLANNIGLMWVAIELATLTAVVVVGLYRTPEALEAAWKYFILGSVGIAMALFGTILVYMAAQPVIGEGYESMVWSVLVTHAPSLSPSLLNVAFVFLMIGYGTKVGLVPMHGWLPDAHAEGPTPVSAILSGLLLNVAIYALLRYKILLSANAAAFTPGALMMTLGLASMVFGAFMLYRRDDIKRMFAYSSIEHMGLMAFAFGLGGPLANFAGLLHMAMHALTKSAIFFAVGQISQLKGTQKMNAIRGLTQSHPFLGWSLVVGVVAIVGMPPLGLFMSEFMIVSAALLAHPALAALFALALLAALAALVWRLTGLAFGEPDARTGVVEISIVPFVAHLLIVLVAGVWLPGPVVAWLQNVARMLE